MYVLVVKRVFRKLKNIRFPRLEVEIVIHLVCNIYKKTVLLRRTRHLRRNLRGYTNLPGVYEATKYAEGNASRMACSLCITSFNTFLSYNPLSPPSVHL